MRITLTVMASTLALAACTSLPEAPATAGSRAEAPAAAGDTTPITGSRFVRKSNDRNVRVIGNDGARTELSDVKSIGNAVGSRGN